MNKRLLYLTHHKLDDNNGGVNASKGFLRCFASIFDDVTLISHSMDNPISVLPPNVTFLPICDKRPKIRKLIDMYRGAISGYYYFVREHLKHHQYDTVVIDHTFTGAGLPDYITRTGAKLITIHHNVERDYLRDNSKEKPLLYRYPFLHYCKKAETDCLRYSDVNLTVTEHDATVFRSWLPDSKVYAWGIFEHSNIQEPSYDGEKAEHAFVITGSLYFRQSLLPILDFLERYWPLVLREIPDAKLTIAGRNPSELLKQVCTEATGVTVIPNPDNMAEVVRHANYYVCPIYAGSGLKLRNLDGLRQGLPILCHDVSANGYERVADSGCLFTYHDEHTFVEALHRLATANMSPHTVFQAYKDSFSQQTGQKLLKEILTQEGII